MSSFWSPQRILLAVVVLASVALIFVVGAQYRATQSAGDSVIRGQAERLMVEARAAFPFDETSLQEVLAELDGEGLRYLAVDGPHRNGHAGESLIDARPLPGEYVRRRGRVRASSPSPPPHPRLDRRSKRGPPPIGRGPPPGRGQIVIEFEPLAWVELQTAAQRQVAGGAFVLFALWIALLVGWRALARSAQQVLTIEKQKRLAMLGEMSATLAHEIRNPLTSLKGHAQLLVESITDAKDKKRSEHIVTEAIRLENLTSELLTFLRSGEITTSDDDPTALLMEVCESEPRTRMHAEDAPESWPFDAPRLRQALTNLIENALQAGDGDVDVTIRAEGDALIFEVEDRGTGIDASVRERMFEPFVTSRTRGTGLGLAMALRVAESHGGTIVAESRKGGGSRFVLTVPRGKEDT